jgi:serine/threonine-protein kinase HipA
MTPMHNFAVLEVLLYGKPIGTLTRLPGDRVLFAFTEGYIADENRPTLSLSFKDALGSLIKDVRPTQTRLPVFFANLLPEGTLRDYLASRAGVKPEREFFLIAILGRDLPGALEIRPADGALPLDENVDRSVEAAEAADSEPVLHFSLAGVQLKFSAVKDATGGLTIPADGVGGSWIVKLPSTRFQNVPENEFAMMELARRVGISVPETALIPIDKISGLPSGINAIGKHAYVIKRFDRVANGERVHMEDFAQVFGVYPERKYDRASYRNIAEVIWTEMGDVGIVEFVRRLVFNFLIGNADMHLKNWSLIYPDRRSAALAPAYDFVSTIAYLPDDRLALTFVDSKQFSSITNDQFERFAAKARLPTKLTLDTVHETVARFAETWRNAPDVLNDDQLREAIDRHLQSVPLWASVSARQSKRGKPTRGNANRQ